MTWQPPSDPGSERDERTDGTGTPTPPAASSGETPSGGPSEAPEPTPYEPSTYEPPPAEPVPPTSGQTPYAQPTSGQTPYAQPQYGQTPYAQPQPTSPQYPQQQYGQPQSGQPQYPPAGYQTPYQQYPVAAQRGTNTMAIVALVCSLGGFVVGISAPIGAILGHMALRQIAQTGEEGAGMAKAAIIIGWILTGLFVLALCFLVVAIIVAAGSVNT
jgi:hypothetical protein